MSELAVFEAELERLEASNRWDDPGYDYVAQRVEELRAARPKAGGTSAATEPDGDQLTKLAADLQAAGANPDRLSDEEALALVRQYNAAVAAADETSGNERVDVADLARQMAVASADPNLDDDRAAELARQFNRAVLQGAGSYTVAELQAALAGDDLPAKLAAAQELDRRGELSDEQATATINAYNHAITELSAARAAMDPKVFPDFPAEVVEALRDARESLERPADPVDQVVGRLFSFLRQQRPPGVVDQLAALGVQQASATQAAEAVENVTTGTTTLQEG